jgi:hypothetical protein
MRRQGRISGVFGVIAPISCDFVTVAAVSGAVLISGNARVESRAVIDSDEWNQGLAAVVAVC